MTTVCFLPGGYPRYVWSNDSDGFIAYIESDDQNVESSLLGIPVIGVININEE